jgi:hypothetical protein
LNQPLFTHIQRIDPGIDPSNRIDVSNSVIEAPRSQVALNSAFRLEQNAASG